MTFGKKYELSRVEQIVEQYQEQFNCPIEFNASNHCVEFQREILDLAILTADADLNAEKRVLCEKAIDSITRKFPIEKRLLALFKSSMLSLPCIDAAAAELNMSKSALHRKLQEANTSYQCELNAFKRKHAEHLLRYTDATISEIAEQVGFSDSSTFRRAFKSWTGHQPSLLRTQAHMESQEASEIQPA